MGVGGTEGGVDRRLEGNKLTPDWYFELVQAEKELAFNLEIPCFKLNIQPVILKNITSLDYGAQ